jgi:hypothetical protein
MQIGSIQLSDFEVPPSIKFGGTHRLSVHKSGSGIRVIDTLGPDDSDIQFRGIFSGPQAELRARALNDLRIGGMPVWLSWNTFRYRVLVKAVRLDYRTRSWILYEATCLVVDQPGANNVASLTAQAQVAADVASALEAAAPLGIDLSAMSSLLSNTVAYPMGSSARASALAQMAGYQTQIANFLPLPHLIDDTTSGSVLEFAESFTTTVVNSGLAGNAVVAAAYLGRISRSL